MSREIDERIVQMKFDNAQFERGISSTMSTLDKFKEKLKFKDTDDGIRELQNVINKLDFSNVIAGSTAAIAKIQLISNAVSKLEHAAERMVKSLSVDQISAGWEKYADITRSTQTIMAATAKDYSDQEEQLKDVNAQLEKLNWFSDETSYSLTDMTNNIGKFTSNGVKLETAVTAMEGISTWAAISGGGKNEASRAMYNLAQALSVGSVKLMDWKSVENANMATQEFKQQVIDTALAMGTLEKRGEEIFVKGTEDALVSVSNFNSELAKGWFNKDVLLSVLNRYGGFTDKLNEYTDKTGLLTSDLLKYIDRFNELDGAEGFKSGELEKILQEINSGLDKDSKITLKELTGYLKELGSAEYELGRRAFKAAQEAKTFEDAIEATKDAVSTGWMKTFQIIFGDYNKARVLWTNVANELYEVFAEGGETRNEVLKEWAELEDELGRNGRDILLEAVGNAWNALKTGINIVKDGVREAFGGITADRLMSFSKWLNEITSKLILSEERVTSLTDIISKALRSLIPIKDLAKSVVDGMKPLAPLLKVLIARFVLMNKFGGKFSAFRFLLIFGNQLLPVLSKLFDTLSGGSDVLKNSANVYSRISKLLSRFSRVVMKFVRGPAKLFSKFAYGLIDAVEHFFNAFAKASDKGANLLESFGYGLKSFFGNAILNVVKIINEVTGLKIDPKKLIEPVYAIANSISKLYDNILFRIDRIKHMMDVFGKDNKLKGFLHAIAFEVGDVFNDVFHWLSEVTGIKWLDDIGGAIFTFFRTIREHIDSFVETITPILEPIKTAFNSVFGIGDEESDTSAMTDPLKVLADSMELNLERIQTVYKTVTELGWEIIRGDWDNGLERDRKITEAGYDNDLVQNNFVNKVLSTAGELKEGWEAVAEEYANTSALLDGAGKVTESLNMNDFRFENTTLAKMERAKKKYEESQSEFAGENADDIEYTKTFTEWLLDAGSEIKANAPTILSAIGKGLGTIVHYLSVALGYINKILGKAVSKAVEFYFKHEEDFKSFGNTVVTGLKDIATFVKELLSTGLSGLADYFEEVSPALEKFIVAILRFDFGGALEALKEFLGSTFGFIAKLFGGGEAEKGESTIKKVGGLIDAITETTEKGGELKDAKKRLLNIQGIVTAVLGFGGFGALWKLAKVFKSFAGIGGSVVLLVTNLAGLSKNLSKYVKKLGKTKLVTYIKTFVGSLVAIGAEIVVLGVLPDDIFQRGAARLAGIAVALIALIALIVLVDKKVLSAQDASNNAGNSGEAFLKIAKGLLLIAASMIILAVAVFLFSRFDPWDLTQGLGAIALIMFGVWGFAKAMNGLDFPSVGKALISIAIAMIFMAAAVFLFGSMDIGTLIKGCLAVAAIMFVFSKMIKTLQSGSQNMLKIGAAVIAFALGVVILVAAVALLGGMDIGTLVKGLVALVVILIALSFAVKKMSSGGGIVKAGGSILAIGLAIIGIAAAVSILGGMDLWSLIKGIGALAIVFALMNGAIKAAGSFDAKSILGVLAMVGFLGAVIFLLTAFDLDALDGEVVLGIGAVIASLAGSVAAIGLFIKMTHNVPLRAGLKSVGLLAAVIGAIVGVMVIIGGIEAFIGSFEGMPEHPLEYLINEAAPALIAVGETIGRVIGALISGFTKQAVDGLDEAGEAISSFMDTVGGIDSSKLENAKGLITFLTDIYSSISIVDAVVTWLTGVSKWDAFAEGLTGFGLALVGFSRIVSVEGAINPEALGAAVDAAVKLNDLYDKLPDHDFISEFTSGDSPWEEFSKGLVAFAGCMVSFAATIKDQSFDDDNFQDLIDLTNDLNGLRGHLPDHTLWQELLWEGDSPWEEFSDGLVEFVEGMSGIISLLNGNEQLGLKKFSYDPTTFAEFEKLTTAVNGLKGKLPNKTLAQEADVGEQNEWEELSTGLVGFVEGMTAFTEMLTTHTFDTSNFGVFKTFVAKVNGLKNYLPNKDKWDEKKYGKTNEWQEISQGLVRFARSMGILDSNLEAHNYDISKLTNFSTFVSNLSSLKTSLPNMNRFSEWLEGNDKYSNFVEGLTNFGTTMSTFSSIMETVDSEHLNSIIPVWDSLRRLLVGAEGVYKNAGYSNNTSALKNLVDIFTKTNELVSVAAAADVNNLTAVGAMYTEAAKMIEGLSAIPKAGASLEDASTVIESLATLLDNLAWYDTSKLSDFGTKFEEAFTTMATSMSGNDKFTDIVTGLTKIFTVDENGLSTLETSITGLVNTMLTAMSSAFDSTNSESTALSSYLLCAAYIYDGLLAALNGEFQQGLIKGLGTSVATTIMSAAAESFDASDKSTTAFEKYTLAGRNLYNGIKGAVDAKKTLLKTVAGTMVKWMLDKLSESMHRFVTIGESLMDGFTSGMESKRTRVMAVAGSIAMSAARRIESVLQIQSPSKVMEADGAYTILGFAKGMEKTQFASDRAASTVANGSADIMREIMARAYLILNEDTNPVITPVVDMSGVASSAGYINRLFGYNTIGSVSIQKAQDIGMQEYTMRMENANAPVDNSPAIISAINDINNGLNSLAQQMTNLQVVMDGGALVGAIAPNMDKALNTRQMYNRRRN